MRTFEILLLLADLLSLAILALARLRNAHRLRLSVIVALAFAIAQLVIEGPRWQMVPAYGLTLLLFVVSMASSFANPGDRAGRRWRTRIAIGAGVVGLAIAALLPAIVPVFGFPPPSGPYAIGTLTFHWADSARPEVFAADSRARRELMVQVWYPAPAQASGARAAYLPDAGVVHRREPPQNLERRDLTRQDLRQRPRCHAQRTDFAQGSRCAADIARGEHRGTG